MESRRILMSVLFILATSTGAAMAAKHLVGGSQGWDESTDFGSWASAQKFKPGDQLVFKYSSGLHSVVELASEAAYKSCDLGTALDSKSTGSDVVKLDKPGTRYFACGTSGHCNQGMKLKVTVLSGTAPSTPETSPSSSSSPPTVKDKDSSAPGFHARWADCSFVLLVVALLVPLLLPF